MSALPMTVLKERYETSNKPFVRLTLIRSILQAGRDFKHEIVERQSVFLACRYLDILLHDPGWTQHLPLSLTRLMAICCLSIAGKIVSKIPPVLQDYVRLSDHKYKSSQLVTMIYLIVKQLKFQLFKVSEFTVLRELIQHSSRQEHKFAPLESDGKVKGKGKDQLLQRAGDLLYCCLLHENKNRYTVIELATAALELASTANIEHSGDVRGVSTDNIVLGLLIHHVVVPLAPVRTRIVSFLKLLGRTDLLTTLSDNHSSNRSGKRKSSTATHEGDAGDGDDGSDTSDEEVEITDDSDSDVNYDTDDSDA